MLRGEVPVGEKHCVPEHLTGIIHMGGPPESVVSRKSVLSSETTPVRT